MAQSLRNSLHVSEFIVASQAQISHRGYESSVSILIHRRSFSVLGYVRRCERPLDPSSFRAGPSALTQRPSTVDFGGEQEIDSGLSQSRRADGFSPAPTLRRILRFAKFSRGSACRGYFLWLIEGANAPPPPDLSGRVPSRDLVL